MIYVQILMEDLPHIFSMGREEREKKTAAVNYLLHIFIDFSANRSLECTFFKGEIINATLLAEVFEWTPFC